MICEDEVTSTNGSMAISRVCARSHAKPPVQGSYISRDKLKSILSVSGNKTLHSVVRFPYELLASS